MNLRLSIKLLLFKVLLLITIMKILNLTIGISSIKKFKQIIAIIMISIVIILGILFLF